eukprot:303206-Rhodomonas_salina.2
MSRQAAGAAAMHSMERGCRSAAAHAMRKLEFALEHVCKQDAMIFGVSRDKTAWSFPLQCECLKLGESEVVLNDD